MTGHSCNHHGHGHGHSHGGGGHNHHHHDDDPCCPGHSHDHGHDHEEEEEEEEVLGDNVIKARESTNPLLTAGTKLEVVCKDGVPATVKHFRAQDLSPQLFEWIMDLFTRNMKSMYRKSQWGWKPKEKKRELQEPAAQYLVLYRKDKPVAFSHFRFDMDFEREVVYCYEVQIEERARGLGLGKFMMDLLYEMACHFELSNVVLTVFTFNNALKFFQHEGYTEDETSPKPEEKSKFFILSKKTPFASPCEPAE